MTWHPQPQMDEAPAVASGQGFRDQNTADKPDSEGSSASDQDKAFVTARAKLALAGWVVHIVDSGTGHAGYWMSRWGQTRRLPDRHALAAFMWQVGCAP